MGIKACASILTLIGFSYHPLFADDGKDSIEFSRPTLSIFQEGTRVVKGGEHIRHLEGFDDLWILPTGGSVGFQVKKNERLALEVMVAATYYSSLNPNAFPQNYVRNVAISLPRLDASYVFGDLTHPILKADFGIFNYKYNEYSRNLGEYMFRSWAYPGFIQTGNAYGYVGNSSVNLTGLKLSQTLGMFSHEILVTLETEMTPIYDLNLTYMAKFNYHNMVKIGGGVQISRAVSNFDPPTMTIHYFEVNGVSYPFDDKGGGIVGTDYYSRLEEGIRERLNTSTLSAADSASWDARCNCEPEGSKTASLSSADSAKFAAEFATAERALVVIDSVKGLSSGNRPKMHDLTARAIKPVLYFSFDPKPLIGSNLFGSKDLVIYGEAAILGVKNYPVYYKNMMERMPMMVGFNLPAFKLLDVLSVEAEYYGSRLLPAYATTNSGGYQQVPVPYFETAYYPTDWDKDNWKWSVYGERTLVRGVTLTAQAASDHARSWDWASFGKTNWEMYTTPSEWYYALKISVRI